MLNFLIALLIGAFGLGLAWWNYRRLQLVRYRLDFSQEAGQWLLTIGLGGVGLFLAYVVMFPPDGTPFLGEGKVLINDANNGRLGRYREPLR